MFDQFTQVSRKFHSRARIVMDPLPFGSPQVNIDSLEPTSLFSIPAPPNDLILDMKMSQGHRRHAHELDGFFFLDSSMVPVLSFLRVLLQIGEMLVPSRRSSSKLPGAFPLRRGTSCLLLMTLGCANLGDHPVISTPFGSDSTVLGVRKK